VSEHPRFLSVDQVAELHRLALGAHGGSEGIRDRAGLEAAVMNAQHLYLYGQEDLFGIAAGYIFHIAESQAFIDGNKRTAVMAAFVFLESNNIPIRFDSMLLHPSMIQIAKSELDRIGLAEVLRNLHKD
jgi:death-on-curing protein